MPSHRRRLGATHLVLIAVAALLGSAGLFAAVTGSASARPTPTPTPNSSPRVTSPTDNHAHAGPDPADFADIRRARPDARPPRNGPSASTGTFTARCGRNENGHRNPDNFIVTPGVRNGAHHLHDYVGNLSTDAFSTDASLRAAGTTCARGDRSAYFWPVLRLTDRKDPKDKDPKGKDPKSKSPEAPEAPAAPDGNTGRVLTPDSAALTFRGNPAARVTAMPAGLRAITGDAKAFTAGPGNARAQWGCTGVAGRHFGDKYPLCPRGSKVVRLLDFPSCWDGRNIDSADHRAHLAFPDARTGRCARGLRPVPQLRMELTYSVPPGPVFAVDSFPEQLRKPVTDHADFANVMPDDLMATVVRCVNSGRRCG
ncbi:DUF1996 domain-containing protein [Streptomyces sp. NPDC053048]|uniref:DUF1996 domain-containing protein n=1 Tax=Streptomyces sp. NPDC053048 TaxID=3365694 RepID=UPI0037CE2314